ncbi:hypothetical protein CVV43_03330 [Candidatus Saccharibacteria bacterium HGW-Saccharibacteria-1]|nr:MAG: hypothetical protein CVV43_03330 [Candidatus Saccharibacteria bacterium HGW-Saccharibacteria-1]
MILCYNFLIMLLQENVNKVNCADNLSRKEVEDLDNLTRPFLDEDFLNRRVDGSSRHLRTYPEIKTQVTEAILGNDNQSILDAVELVSLARDI